MSMRLRQALFPFPWCTGVQEIKHPNQLRCLHPVASKTQNPYVQKFCLSFFNLIANRTREGLRYLRLLLGYVPRRWYFQSEASRKQFQVPLWIRVNSGRTFQFAKILHLFNKISFPLSRNSNKLSIVITDHKRFASSRDSIVIACAQWTMIYIYRFVNDSHETLHSPLWIWNYPFYHLGCKDMAFLPRGLSIGLIRLTLRAS